MHRIAWVLVAAGLSIGASRCEEKDPEGPVPPPMEGEGAAGGGATSGGAAGAISPGNDKPPTRPTTLPACGGIAGIPCKGVARCMDDPSDSCDPRRGGADCGGVCVCDVIGSCIEGHRFDGTPGVCDCVPAPGDDPGAPPPKPDPRGVECGKNTCAAGEECCNPSCGTCVPKGGFCTEQFCEPEPEPEPGPEPKPVTCGKNTCAGGESCCNPSCGICAKPGEGCTKQLCPDDPGEPDEPIPGRPCDTKCEEGQHCEYQEVVCVRAPCPPLPTCVDTPRCGGFAGFTCPGSGMCEDDPRDDCDPNNGGADCGGLCECQLQGVCKDGSVWNASPTVCGCEPAGGGGSGGGEQCGKNTCEKGMVCCNASCGICTPPDGACIQIACL